jgi:hypothetical protein
VPLGHQVRAKDEKGKKWLNEKKMVESLKT